MPTTGLWPLAYGIDSPTSGWVSGGQGMPLANPEAGAARPDRKNYRNISLLPGSGAITITPQTFSLLKTITRQCAFENYKENENPNRERIDGKNPLFYCEFCTLPP